ncbi:serine hydrolase [uncultured Agrococcus sp.]|uniref:serine hydrolase domain-containing protein n=1 Tax=uncultured Agrococcus sp. TaxID=382258 RepID=UPI0025FA2B66|nr:serine hydrolase domain-containing protein [uncultured Agrococcus sp.]
MAFDLQKWQTTLDEHTANGMTPGVSLAVLADGEVHTAASGVLNIATGVEATTDSVFQIGSVTKLYTSTILLALSDEGLLDVDEPIVTYLPELTWPDPDARRSVTTRHLLTHTSGIDGDHFLDLGRGEDVLSRYVDTLGELTQVLPVGAAWSYCNTGFAVAGRLVEKLTGLTFDEAVMQRLFAPLGLDHSCTLPEEALKFRAAYGHVPSAEGLELAPTVSTPRTMGSAGGIISTAYDVIEFARLYLNDGVSRSGDRLLSEDSVLEALTPQAVVWDPSMASHWGLGWMLTEWGGKRVVGHDGGTVGQGAFLRMIPEDGIAIALVGTGPGIAGLMKPLFDGIVGELSGVRPPESARPSDDTVTEQPWFGVYERKNMRIEVDHSADGPAVSIEIAGLAAESLGTDSVTGELEIAADGTYLTNAFGEWMPIVPFTIDDGTDGLHFAGRAQPRAN